MAGRRNDWNLRWGSRTPCSLQLWRDLLTPVLLYLIGCSCYQATILQIGNEMITFHPEKEVTQHQSEAGLGGGSQRQSLALQFGRLPRALVRTFSVSQATAMFEGVREEACLSASATLCHLLWRSHGEKRRGTNIVLDFRVLQLARGWCGSWKSQRTHL